MSVFTTHDGRILVRPEVRIRLMAETRTWRVAGLTLADRREIVNELMDRLDAGDFASRRGEVVSSFARREVTLAVAAFLEAQSEAS